MKALNRAVSTGVLLCFAAVVVGGEPVTPTFTYQGQLKKDGAPLTGDVDLLVSVWDAEFGGAEMFNDTFDTVSVTDGLFSVQVPVPPGMFAGEKRWLEIEVRYPTTTGTWTPLTPRELIATAPYAAYALSDGNWTSSGGAMMNKNSGFVGINRNYPVGSEYFGVHAPVETSYGGMYISTAGAAGLPFYGYYTGSTFAWHYMDGTTGNWMLSLNGSDRVTVTQDGNVGIGNTAPQASLHIGGAYTPTVSGSVARINGLLAVKGTVVSDEGNILARSEAGNRAAVVQVDASNNSGGVGWSMVSNASSSPYGGATGSLSFYTDGVNHFSLGSDGTARLGTGISGFGKFTLQQSSDNSSGGFTILNRNVVRSLRLWVDSANVPRIDSGGGTSNLAINASGGDVGIAVTDPEAQLHVGTGTDVNSVSGGYLLLGSHAGANIGIDNNEIMARNNGAVAELHLQAEGGNLSIASSGESDVAIGDTVLIESSEGGSDGAQMRLYDAAGNATFELDAEEGGGGGVVFLRNSINNTTIELDSDESDNGAIRVSRSTGDAAIELRSNVSSAGWVSLRGDNGNYNVVLTRENASANHGWIDVSDASGNPQAGCYINSSGNGVVWGDTKSFRVPNPRDPETDIWYASLEGPEAAAYARGTAQLVNGRAVIPMPDHFVDVCSHTSITMHLTPRSADSKGLAFLGIGEGGAVVAELGGAQGNYAFDYLIMDVRAGHEAFQVIRPKMVRSLVPSADAGDPEEVASAVPAPSEVVAAATTRVTEDAEVRVDSAPAPSLSTDDQLAELTTRLARLERLLATADARDAETDTER